MKYAVTKYDCITQTINSKRKTTDQNDNYKTLIGYHGITTNTK